MDVKSLGLAAVACLCLCALVNCDSSNKSEPRAPPHIVFIVADDLGWNDVGWHNPEILTPNLNHLASQGIKLESSYVSPTCSPSRNSFMTGMFAFHTELQRALDPSEPNFLPLKYPTIAEKLKLQGYATHMVGKWHLGYCNEKYTPMRRGFDSFLGFYMGSQDYYTHEKPSTTEETASSSASFSSFGHVLMNSFVNMRVKGWAVGRDFRFNTTLWRKTEGRYSTSVFADRAIDIINSHDTHVPLFLYLPFQAPHSPLQVPKAFELLYSHIDSRIRRVYSGMVSALDEAVGRITDALNENGLSDNLLLVFTSDNGGYPYMGGNNMPLRGTKNTIWEGGTRVPTFVYSPTLLKNTGYVSNGLFHAADWFPTFLDAAGAPPVDGIDGVSQWPMLKEGTESKRSEFVYSIDPAGKGAIRVGDYKLIVGKPGLYNDWYSPPGSKPVHRARFRGGRHDNVTVKKGSQLLFNIKDDPSEERNLAPDMPEMVTALMERYVTLNATKVKLFRPERDAQAHPSLHGGFWSPGWC